MSDAVVIKVPSEAKQKQVKELILEEEGFKFSTIKLNRERPRYEIPAPTEEDQDNVNLVKEFNAVVLCVRKNFYQSDEDKEAGKQAKEKRTLYILREGRVTPERIFVSPTSVTEWKKLIKAIAVNGQPFFGVIVNFAAEHIKSQKSGFAWNKIKFGTVRSLTEEELGYIEQIRTWVDGKVGTFDDEADLDKYEDEAVFGGSKAAAKSDDDDPTEAHSKKAAASVEDDDEGDPPAKPAKGEKAKASGGTASKSVDDDEEEDPPAKPAKGAAKKAADDDSSKAASAGRAGYPSLDDDEDIDPPAKGTKAVAKPADDEDDD